MLEDIIVLIIVFSFSVYIAQIFFVIIDLCMGRYSILSKKQIKMMLIPFGFIVGCAGAVVVVIWLFDKLVCKGE